MVKRVKYNSKNPINLYLVGDMHIGSKTHDKKAFKETISIIKKDNKARVVLMGDMGEYIFKDDTRRYNPETVVKGLNTARKTSDHILSILNPIKKKIIGVLSGNHESAYTKYHLEEYTNTRYRNEGEYIAKKLGTTYLHDMSIMELKIKKYKYDLVLTHGVNTGPKISSQITKLQGLISNFDVTPDLMAMGHCHSLQCIISPKLDFNFNTKIKHLALTGNYYRTYIEGNMNYASTQLYAPLPVGCVMYEFDGKGTIKDNKIILG